MLSDAFDQIYIENRNFVARYLASRLRNAADVEDLTQETFTRLWDWGRTPEHVRPVLLRMARNSLIDWQRKKKTAKRAGDYKTQSLIDGMTDQISSTDSPEEDYRKRELYVACTKEPFIGVMYFVHHGFTEFEIAIDIGKNRSWVQRQLAFERNGLKGYLESQYIGPDFFHAPIYRPQKSSSLTQKHAE